MRVEGRRAHLALTILAGAALALLVAACGGGGGSGDTLTIYNGQHEDLAKSLAEKFTKQTGIKISLRSGEDEDLANEIKEEGSSTSADVLLTEEPGPVAMLAREGLFAPVKPSTLHEVDQRFVPSSGDWLPYAARSRVIYFDPNLIAESELPHSILELTQPRWKGKFAYASSGAFVSTVSYLIHTIGKERTLEWLKGIKANGINEESNGKVRDTVEAGQHPFGLSNHYYWWRLAEEEGGPQNLTSRIFYFNHPDAGGLVLPSGAAILKSSDHQAEAQRFLAWLGSAKGGQLIVGGADANKDGAQYPVAPGVNSKVGLKPLSQLHPPKVDPSVYGEPEEAKELLVEAGIV